MINCRPKLPIHDGSGSTWVLSAVLQPLVGLAGVFPSSEHAGLRVAGNSASLGAHNHFSECWTLSKAEEPHWTEGTRAGWPRSEVRRCSRTNRRAPLSLCHRWVQDERSGESQVPQRRRGRSGRLGQHGARLPRSSNGSFHNEEVDFDFGFSRRKKAHCSAKTNPWTKPVPTGRFCKLCHF